MAADREALYRAPHPTGRVSVAPLTLAAVPSALLLSHHTKHCFSLCRCCTLLACDCRMKCPDSWLCSCNLAASSKSSPIMSSCVPTDRPPA